MTDQIVEQRYISNLVKCVWLKFDADWVRCINVLYMGHSGWQ